MRCTMRSTGTPLSTDQRCSVMVLPSSVKYVLVERLLACALRETHRQLPGEYPLLLSTLSMVSPSR